MSLRVIGAGWGRTGTFSLQEALQRLGLPCHHMREVFQHPEHSELFLEAADASDFDWERIYAPYAATVDFPGCVFWRELHAFYPDAKVLLTTRPSVSWYESYRATIHQPIVDGWSDDDGSWNRMVQRVIVDRALRGEPSDRDHVIAAFERHNAAVAEAIPADRLLVYEVSQGWEPLCGFLGVTVPAEPFPHLVMNIAEVAQVMARSGWTPGQGFRIPDSKPDRDPTPPRLDTP